MCCCCCLAFFKDTNKWLLLLLFNQNVDGHKKPKTSNIKHSNTRKTRTTTTTKTESKQIYHDVWFFLSHLFCFTSSSGWGERKGKGSSTFNQWTNQTELLRTSVTGSYHSDDNVNWQYEVFFFSVKRENSQPYRVVPHSHRKKQKFYGQPSKTYTHIRHILIVWEIFVRIHFHLSIIFQLIKIKFNHFIFNQSLVAKNNKFYPTKLLG